MMAVIAVAGISLIIIVLAYLRWIRPWQLRWGATDEELERAMPGDEIVIKPTFNATRAVTIDATPEQIWPWIAQLGFGRAGWYTYDWLDNLGRPSATRVLPEFQHLAVGDVVPLGPAASLEVRKIEPQRYMVWAGGDRSSWTWGLYLRNGSQSRLVTRVRLRYRWLHPSIVFHLLIEFADIIMMRKCLLGIKQRAEQSR